MSQVVRQLCFLLSLSLAGLTFAWFAFASDGPVYPKGKGDSCVAETEFMRKNHMDVLLHQRDETVIDGIRGKPFSLVGCVDCHASEDDNGEMLRVDAEGQFCESCHSFAAVKMDCFGCHAAVPEKQDTASLNLDTQRSVHSIFSGPFSDQFFGPFISKDAKLHGFEQFKSK